MSKFNSADVLKNGSYPEKTGLLRAQMGIHRRHLRMAIDRLRNGDELDRTVLADLLEKDLTDTGYLDDMK